MRFLVDNALSPRLAGWMRDHGLDALHVRDIGIGSAPDAQIFELARQENRTVLSADTDFGTVQSLILFRGEIHRRPERQLTLLLALPPKIQVELERGCIVVVHDSKARVGTLTPPSRPWAMPRAAVVPRHAVSFSS